MANTLFTPDEAAKVTAAYARKDLVLVNTVNRDVEADYAPGRGIGTVHVRVPGSAVAGTKSPSDTTTPLATGQIVEQTIPVPLDTLVYHRNPLSVRDVTLSLHDYSTQILAPQAEAVAEYVENRLVTAMQATPETETLTFDPANPAKMFTAARGILRGRGVPAGAPLIAAVGANVYGALLDAEAIGPDGKVRTFEVIESTRLGADEFIAYVPEAFAVALRAPIAPEGAPFAASVKVNDDKGRQAFAALLIRQWNPTVAVEESVVSLLAGAQAMPLPVKNGATVDLVENGGVVRVVTA
ncbi:P22 phage major capsid protein family protein [Cellulosimicrobium sp. TH-20]|uniref:P22 phage major capsid protein family protein n=1 Tax=Cellulosimicrobium sp. TH-20 TaxID=1980001 RepID=UPI0011A30D88|nr:P22 phage major capsid protein family protein [Cellulosimicrobium sp. TH-20]